MAGDVVPPSVRTKADIVRVHQRSGRPLFDLSSISHTYITITYIIAFKLIIKLIYIRNHNIDLLEIIREEYFIMYFAFTLLFLDE